MGTWIDPHDLCLFSVEPSPGERDAGGDPDLEEKMAWGQRGQRSFLFPEDPCAAGPVSARQPVGCSPEAWAVPVLTGNRTCEKRLRASVLSSSAISSYKARERALYGALRRSMRLWRHPRRSDDAWMRKESQRLPGCCQGHRPDTSGTACCQDGERERGAPSGQSTRQQSWGWSSVLSSLSKTENRTEHCTRLIWLSVCLHEGCKKASLLIDC
jgi:hypothetical protein